MIQICQFDANKIEAIQDNAASNTEKIMLQVSSLLNVSINFFQNVLQQSFLANLAL